MGVPVDSAVVPCAVHPPDSSGLRIHTLHLSYYRKRPGSQVRVPGDVRKDSQGAYRTMHCGAFANAEPAEDVGEKDCGCGRQGRGDLGS